MNSLDGVEKEKKCDDDNLTTRLSINVDKDKTIYHDILSAPPHINSDDEENRGRRFLINSIKLLSTISISMLG